MPNVRDVTLVDPLTREKDVPFGGRFRLCIWLECASPPKLHRFAKLPLRLSGTADLARKKTVAQVFLVKPKVQRSVLHVY